MNKDKLEDQQFEAFKHVNIYSISEEWRHTRKKVVFYFRNAAMWRY
jgi:hypothetical protein